MELEDDLDILNIIEFGFPRRIYQRENPFEMMDDLSFYRRFRLHKETVLHLLQQIEHNLEFDNDLNNSLSPINQLLTTLRFYATCGHQNAIGDFMGMHQSTASRIIRKVSEAIATLRPQYIRMPLQREIIHTQNEFYQISRFPRVIGCVDGTHIKIQSPGGEDGEVFRNRKGYFSFFVICDSKLNIIDIVARWPGSAHDMTIFNNSYIRARFEAGEFPDSSLLGDSGYTLRPYLLTPLLNPVRPEENRYNEAHIRTRNTVERTFGIWKRRFPVLAYELRCKLDTSLIVIIATAVLHNIAQVFNENVPPPPENINAEELNYLIDQGNVQPVPIYRANHNYDYRRILINNFFLNL
ncbi:hypothetical protein NQ317_009290 [Molorchus minor]|uniref:DDE Tnp4 domain-containing protein n=1 Tax=Molorchus minor TaxID=1323400 RepID=A0ABQ9IRJ9_9CUCU|nr:hypothetical protein NQ317_009290 [Molorchus minor]